MVNKQSYIGKVVNAKIVEKSTKYIKVQIDDNFFGEVSSSELGELSFNIGDTIEVYVADNEAFPYKKKGSIHVSYEKAILVKTWDKLSNSLNNKSIVLGEVEKKLGNDLGFAVLINGIRTFLPKKTSLKNHSIIY